MYSCRDIGDFCALSVSFGKTASGRDEEVAAASGEVRSAMCSRESKSILRSHFSFKLSGSFKKMVASDGYWNCFSLFSFVRVLEGMSESVIFYIHLYILFLSVQTVL